jgi:uridylate kinase
VQPKFKKILLKLSGEALMGEGSYGLDKDVLQFVADEVKSLISTGVQVGVVIGAGNIFRGVSVASVGMNRVNADNMGMLATVMNSLALQDIFEKNGLQARVLSAIPMPLVCESYSRQQANHHLEKGRVVIFGAGSGNPFFTTDTAAVLRGLEIEADVICKATRVDGVYDSDPLINNEAVKFDELTYSEVLSRRLKVMDSTAISLAMDNQKKILVFNMNIPGNMVKAICGEKIGTLIRGDLNE